VYGQGYSLTHTHTHTHTALLLTPSVLPRFPLFSFVLFRSLSPPTQMVKQPIFLIYTALVLVVMVVLILYTAPRYGSTHILVYTTICSLAGSVTVQVRDPQTREGDSINKRPHYSPCTLNAYTLVQSYTTRITVTLNVARVLWWSCVLQ
jgi:hypothetical protein